jgi:CRP-like cAMP-binding protein
MDKKIREELQKVELFSCLTEEQLDMMAEGSRITSIPSKAALIHQDGNEDDVYLIISGNVEILRKLSDCKDGRCIAKIGPGEIIGEISALTNRPSSASVVATTACTAVQIPRGVFLESVRKNLTAMSKLTLSVVRRVRETMGS